ncbi:MAG: hypothetical protein GX785_17370 [Armatimonadetes bacterium]|nr:hypothetical protein [Armatimonadota bacterium]
MFARLAALLIAVTCSLASPVVAQEPTPAGQLSRPPAAGSATASGPLTIANEFIRVVVNRGPNEAGRFSIGTTGGDPSRPQSANKHLIFGGSSPWTSYTTLSIDGTSYVFGGPTTRRAGKAARYGKLISAPQITPTSVTHLCQLGEIEVAQELAFMRGPSTRMFDTVQITYRLTNRGAATHRVGLRLLLDTMLGTNDGAPVRAGSEAITAACALAGKAVPDYWQAFDSIAKPTVISQGSLRGGELTPPDKILFADWGTLADEAWEPALTPGQGFTRLGETDPDTATALFWNPEPLPPGATRIVRTAYGIGGVSLQPGKLALGLTAPSESTFLHERTQPITVAGYLENAGGFDARDVTLRLALPAGLELVAGQPTMQFARLAPNETIQGSWTLRPNGKASGELPVTLTATSANIEQNSLTRRIQVHVPSPRLSTLVERVSVPLETNGLPTVVLVPVTLSPATSFVSARIVLTYDPEVIRAFDLSRGRAFVDQGALLPGWSYDLSQPGRVIITATRGEAPPLTQAEANLGVVRFRSVAPGVSALKLEEVELINGKGERIPAECLDAAITVIRAKE